jgi:hypothetical protein
MKYAAAPLMCTQSFIGRVKLYVSKNLLLNCHNDSKIIQSKT